MRKIFIDGGANKGQSTKAFLNQWPNAEEFEIFMFEPNSSPPRIQGRKTKLIREAIWIYDGEILFYEKGPNSEGNTLLKEKTKKEKRNFKQSKVKCFSLSNWIRNNFDKKDYIILKLDIEGAEYEVIKDLEDNGVFEFVDLFFCEIHGLKCGKTFEESIELIEICKNNNIIPYRWNGDTFNYQDYSSRVYTEEHMTNEFNKWKKRGLK